MLFKFFFINVIVCLIMKPENVQIGLFRGQFMSLFKYLEKKKSSILHVHELVIVIPKYQSNFKL